MYDVIIEVPLRGGMETIMIDNISPLKVGCGKFYNGKGVITLLKNEIQRFGGRALFIGGPTALDLVMNSIATQLEEASLSYFVYKHTEQCTTEWAHKYADIARENDCTVLVACGGGKCIDTVKCASYYSDLPIITVPTSIATCAATSMVAIMYDEIGRRGVAITLKKEIDVCIADDYLIGTAPKRLLAAGILDSIAKLPESIHQKHVSSYQDCSLREYIQIINAKGIYEFLVNEINDLYTNGKDAKRFSDCILTNLLHTSIVSGFADGSGQLAIAHATYDFMRTYNTENSATYLHGEIVAVGILIQMFFNREDLEEINKIRNLMRFMEMPLCLKDLNFDCTKANIQYFIDIIASKSNISSEAERNLLNEAVNFVL